MMPVNTEPKKGTIKGIPINGNKSAPVATQIRTDTPNEPATLLLKPSAEYNRLIFSQVPSTNTAIITNCANAALLIFSFPLSFYLKRHSFERLNSNI